MSETRERKDYTNSPLCLSGRGVTKVFGLGDKKTVAVDHVDFDFHEGEKEFRFCSDYARLCRCYLLRRSGPDDQGRGPGNLDL